MIRAIVVVVAALLGACVAGGRARPGRIEVVPVKVPIEASLQVRVDAWTRLSTATEGKTVEVQAAAEVPLVIRQIFDEGIPEGPVDVVFVVDTTGSMVDDIDAVKRDMREILDHLRARNPDHRVGVVTYRDIHDEYLTRTFATLGADRAAIEAAISAIQVTGGDDWREHVYAGIHTALDRQPWRPEASQHILLMGDAPPHDDYANDPRDYEAVTAKATTAPLHVRIHTIGIKCDASCTQALSDEEQAKKLEGRLAP